MYVCTVYNVLSRMSQYVHVLNVIGQACLTRQGQGAETLLEPHHIACVATLCSVQYVLIEYKDQSVLDSHGNR